MTDYVVLQIQEGRWRENGMYAARSARAAVQTCVASHSESDEGGIFVAIPARSWKPVTVKVETKTALKFS